MNLTTSSQTFKDILESARVKAFLPNDSKWWSKFIYHFSDVNNIASILNSGFLYSRNHDMSQLLMKNDNASKTVIDGTNGDYKDHVRFYFRPLTPTQFQNEGIRSHSEHSSLNAHCPVPIFLLFNADKLLSRDDSYFSYESLASHRDVQIYQSLDDFKNAPFENIYHHTPIREGEDKNQIVKQRHAEIIIKDEYGLDELELILCRTIPEKDTLISLLPKSVYEKYKPKIKVYKQDLFLNKFLNLNSVTLEKKYWN
ncbi:DarT ssDNA thymidine ADP-ribosyltransferase family protein [Peribacillus frigoritolerans]|uniref:DarT ssDNA thymidine ADP-ribosyltransferase family protein n=1 Tax=Peribacillus frigoritolerans TaxID=450367 RepID=A0AAJ1QKJ4_9BACI|nr:DarT ssDNA thymidine ADP-ribosyltransferase family protein [Peribacillus frigoritolerans]MDM5282679.1 DarT ssDNA thymidine ADP-ribosyltransferase family protein [Peribacillus frigoritolerans]